MTAEYDLLPTTQTCPGFGSGQDQLETLPEQGTDMGGTAHAVRSYSRGENNAFDSVRLTEGRKADLDCGENEWPGIGRKQSEGIARR